MKRSAKCWLEIRGLIYKTLRPMIQYLPYISSTVSIPEDSSKYYYIIFVANEMFTTFMYKSVIHEFFRKNNILLEFMKKKTFN